MNSSEIRQSFLDYFESKGHTVVPSSSLVPDDPTLLLVNAGMVQFKNLFLGRESRSYQRAVTAQKCARLSGKHNDIEEVGPSPRHQTFFEMMGNFSFGDYFKDEAIQYAWEYSTQILKLNPNQLWATVFEDDDEAYDLWIKNSSLPPERIQRLGEKDNWWSMGDTGPNGPCSEIFFDRGIEKCTCKLKGKCNPKSASEVEDCNRFWEFWNLVFMQFHTHSDGTTTALENPSVDTGMGLERVTAIMQNADANYDTDLFQPIFDVVQKLTGHSESEMNEHYVAYRVIADHGRAMTFLSADGVIPGNEDRSYVLRMLIRRALRFGLKIGLDKPFLNRVCTAVINMMGDAYPDLLDRKDFILESVQQEEEKFSKTFSTRMESLEKLFEQKKRKGQNVISGKEAFSMHDTHGFHIQILEDIAKERDFAVDRDGYEAEMELQRERSKVEKDDTAHSLEDLDLDSVNPTHFRGYDLTSCEAELTFIVKDPHDHFLVSFSDTPFYAEGGGQASDAGKVLNLSQSGEGKIVHVEKSKRGHFIHTMEISAGSFSIGDRCKLEIDPHRRKAIERNHTATHILHAALRKVLEHKTGIQAGSRVTNDELRFDFTHFSAVNDIEIKAIEDIANDVILKDLPIVITEEKLESAKSKGAMAMFAEDYQGKESVRVVSIVSEEGNGTPFSIELCGGTHVNRTGEIGLFKVLREEGVASGVRRVYVTTGYNALDHLRQRESLLVDASEKLKVADHEILHKLDLLLEQKTQLERELKQVTSANLSDQTGDFVNEAESIHDCNVLLKVVDLEVDQMKELADLIEEKLENGIVVLGSNQNGRAMLISKVSEAMTKRIRAGDLIRQASEIVGGKGGGNPRFAQGGGDQPEKLSDALDAIRDTLKESLSP